MNHLDDMDMKQTHKELTILFICLFILAGLAILAILSRHKQEQEVKAESQVEFPWDYQINLHHDSVYIITDYGDTLAVHADSLCSFIEQDNM